MDRFPYGKAPFWILIVALASTGLLIATHDKGEARPDLIIAVFAAPHREAYLKAIPKFEQEHGVKVGVQLIDYQALEARLQSAIVSGTDVPDITEISEGTLGFFTRGPESDIGFVNLTQKVKEEGLDKRVVEARYGPWTSKGRIFALPHDVHPVMLAYRRDVVEELGIDVSKLETWDDFVREGQRISVDKDGDGTIDRFMIDMPRTGGWGLQILLAQRGVRVFDKDGNLTFNTPECAEVMLWHLRQMRGPKRIAYEAGWGQPLMKAMNDGLVVFYFTPDWRSKNFEMDVPRLKGKMALMPLPAWHKGGIRTSSWGMTGLTISKSSKHQELAWELAKYLYFSKEDLGDRFLITNIIPPLKEAWDLPQFATPNEFWSNQAIGQEYAKLAPDVPPAYSSPIYKTTFGKLDEALTRAGLYYDEHGEDGIEAKIKEELDRAEEYLQLRQKRHAVIASIE
jgi:arabinosaccharide transport system substrate-binding protein